MNCTSNKVCGCNSDQYLTNDTCNTKKSHGAECNGNEECATSFGCRNYTSNIKRCLCVESNYYTSSTNSCTSVDSLKVSPSLDTKGTDFITLKWTASKPDTRTVVYYMETNGQSVQANTTSGTIRNLQAGQSYTITVISSLQDDAWYPTMNTSVQFSPVTTIKTHGQECQTPSECQRPLVCKNYINTKTFCLCDTTFFYNGSSGCVSIDTLKVSPSEGPKGTDFITLNWTASKPDTRTVVYYMETNGQSVQANTSTGTIRNLQAGQSYTITVISSLQDDAFYSAVNTSVPYGPVTTNTKTHGQECGVQTECSNTFVCVNYTSGTRKCLCDANSYYTDTGGCSSVDIMKVTNVNTIKDTQSIQLTWSSGGINRNNAKYSIETSESKVVTANTDGGTVSNLIPGSPYNFTIKTTLPADDNYPEKTALVPTSVTWTNPTQPGPVQTVQLSTVNTTTAQYKCVITIEKSEGLVKEYTITIFDSFSELEKINSTNTTFIAEKLKPVINYSYSIIATNEVNAVSAATNGTFLTPPSASNEVSDLKVEAITGLSAFIEWQSPTLPNGDIIGYIAVVRDEQQNCVAVHKISCRECNTTALVNPCSFGWNSSQTFDNISLNNQSFPINVTIIGLKPYRNYKVEVSPYNVIGKGLDAYVTFRTNVTGANDLISLSATATKSSENIVGLIIAWTPGDFTGPTNYTIILESEKSLTNNNEFQREKNITVQNYESRNFTFPDLLAYWNYKVSVHAYTSEGSGRIRSVVNQTLMNTPGLAEFNIVNNSVMALDINITITCPPEQQRNGTITKYRILKQLLSASDLQQVERNLTQDIGAPNSCETKSVPLSELSVERNYLIKVMTINSQYNGSYSSGTPLYVYPKVPRLKEVFPGKTIVEIKTATETTLVAEVCRTCLTDERQGLIQDLVLVVCGFGSDCFKAGRKKRAIGPYGNWSVAKKENFKIPYRTTPPKWIQELKADSKNDFVNYIIGSDGSCKTDNSDFCNGPLPSNTKFKVFVYSCNGAGCDEVYSQPMATQEETNNTPAIIGGVIGGIAILAILAAVIVIAVLYFRKRPQPSSHSPLWDIDTKKIKDKRPIRIREFREEVRKLHKDSNLLFQGEFEDIKNLSARFPHTSDEAKREGNRVKNRYVDILPYDHTRVKLDIQPEDDDTMDFINANYIPGYTSVREYIATQGPMHCTIPDFWRMTWEQKCPVIVMLSDLQEQGKRKVDLYWPENLNEPINYGNIIVEMTNFSQLNKYIIRNFTISKGPDTRKVTHFFLPGWWDFSANLTTGDVLEFAKLVRQMTTPAQTGPIIVHCSAGVGRTGTFIALDYFMQFIEKHSLDESIDVFSYVMKMRNNRPRMVQAETQYIFIFDALDEIIAKKIKEEEERENEGTYQNVKVNEENVYANTKTAYDNEGFEPEYQNMSFGGQQNGSYTPSQNGSHQPTTSL